MGWGLTTLREAAGNLQAQPVSTVRKDPPTPNDEAPSVASMSVKYDPNAVGAHRVTRRLRNPWGQVPLTAGGRALHGGSRDYMDRLVAQSSAPDPKSRRHHYVPKAYLKQWSPDGKRIWALDTVTHRVGLLGLSSVCVEEDFYRISGPDGVPHNRVELMFGVVDTELRRVQTLFNQLRDPDELEFDDLIALGVSLAMQRLRTVQQRRLRNQHNAWLVAQNPDEFQSFEDPHDPYLAASLHTRLQFQAMWEASDVMTTRQIEIWDDPGGRFWTCDAPVLVPFARNVRPSLLSAPVVIWPISPHRSVALSINHQGEKATFLRATGKMVGLVRDGVEEGRERMIFASEDQRERLPKRKKFRRRTQVRLRCSQKTPSGEPVDPPGCCVEYKDTYADRPDIVLCNQGLHLPAPEMLRYV